MSSESDPGAGGVQKPRRLRGVARASADGAPDGGAGKAASLEDTRPGVVEVAPGWTPRREVASESAALQVASVEAGGWRFAVPAAAVVHQARLSRAEGEAVAAAGVYHLDGQPAPAVRLAELSSFLPPADWSPQEAAVMVVEAAGRLALLVDRLLPRGEISFEPFPLRSATPSSICGIGVAPTGERAAVLDPRRLLRRQREERAGGDPEPEPAPGTLFIADDCLGTRQGLSRLAVHLGFEPLLARDGFEALESLSASAITPALLLLDAELPGINADELVALLRAQGALRQVPVVLLTSVSADLTLLAGQGASASLLRPFRLETAAAVIRLLAGGQGTHDDGQHPGR